MKKKTFVLVGLAVIAGVLLFLTADPFRLFPKEVPGVQTGSITTLDAVIPTVAGCAEFGENAEACTQVCALANDPSTCPAYFKDFILASCKDNAECVRVEAEKVKAAYEVNKTLPEVAADAKGARKAAESADGKIGTPQEGRCKTLFDCHYGTQDKVGVNAGKIDGVKRGVDQLLTATELKVKPPKSNPPKDGANSSGGQKDPPQTKKGSGSMCVDLRSEYMNAKNALGPTARKAVCVAAEKIALQYEKDWEVLSSCMNQTDVDVVYSVYNACTEEGTIVGWKAGKLYYKWGKSGQKIMGKYGKVAGEALGRAVSKPLKTGIFLTNACVIGSAFSGDISGFCDSRLGLDSLGPGPDLSYNPTYNPPSGGGSGDISQSLCPGGPCTNGGDVSVVTGTGGNLPHKPNTEISNATPATGNMGTAYTGSGLWQAQQPLSSMSISGQTTAIAADNTAIKMPGEVIEKSVSALQGGSILMPSEFSASEF